MRNPDTMSSPCRNCKNMVCRTRQRDCYDVRADALGVYRGDVNVLETAHAASALIDNGRAGTLNRIEEIIAFCQGRDFKYVGIAYCFGLKDLSMELCDMLEQAGLHTLPVSCTSGAVLERDLDNTKEGDVVSCNPAGQALVLNRKAPDIVVEMGLCLGHDMIFHQTLQVPVTVLLVKDRTVGHHPASLFSGYRDRISTFLTSMDNSFAMKSAQWLSDEFKNANEDRITVVDVRTKDAFDNGHIPHSIHIPLAALPSRYDELSRERTIVCVCNGSVQSAYAIAFLYTRGFNQVYNLSGGISRWVQEGYAIERSSAGS